MIHAWNNESFCQEGINKYGADVSVLGVPQINAPQYRIKIYADDIGVVIEIILTK